MRDARVPISTLLAAFGVPATVTRPAPDDAAIVTTLAWISPLTADAPAGASSPRRERRCLAVLSREAVPTLPKGTSVEAPEMLDGDVLTWVVDGIDRVDVDEHRAWLIQVEVRS